MNRKAQANTAMEEFVRMIPKLIIFILLLAVLVSVYLAFQGERIKDQNVLDFMRVTDEISDIGNKAVTVPLFATDVSYFRVYTLVDRTSKGSVPGECINAVDKGSCICIFSEYKDKNQDKLEASACRAYGDDVRLSSKERVMELKKNVIIQQKVLDSFNDIYQIPKQDNTIYVIKKK